MPVSGAHNSGEFLAKGRVYSSLIKEKRLAIALDGNPGGGVVEYIIDPKDVKILKIIKVEPPF